MDQINKHVSQHYGRTIVVDNVEFKIDRDYLEKYHSTMAPQTIEGKRWHYVSHVYGGQGYHAQLLMDDDGSLRVFYYG